MELRQLLLVLFSHPALARRDVWRGRFTLYKVYRAERCCALHSSFGVALTDSLRSNFGGEKDVRAHRVAACYPEPTVYDVPVTTMRRNVLFTSQPCVWCFDGLLYRMCSLHAIPTRINKQ